MTLILAFMLAFQQFTYTAQEQITVAGTAIGFTAATINVGDGHAQANTATCRNETAQIRVTVDGTTPTSTVGTLVEIGDTFQVSSNNAMNLFRAIRTGGTSGKLTCNYSS